MGNGCGFKPSSRLHFSILSTKVKGDKPIEQDSNSKLCVSKTKNHKHDQQNGMGTIHEKPQNIVKMLIPPKNKAYIPFLTESWPGSILNWSKDDIEKFAACFTPHFVKDGEEVSGFITF